jgi:hypothetical protein
MARQIELYFDFASPNSYLAATQLPVLAAVTRAQIVYRPFRLLELVIDAVIDLAWARERYKDKPNDFFIQPAAIADEIWHVAHQDRCAWSFNVELRPFGETW